MKRSEMVKRIAEHIHDAIEVYAAGRGVKDELFADKILRDLEQKGMIPPADMTIYSNSGGAHRWEPEDGQEV